MLDSRALYPGTFDPVNLGHLDILRRALGLFEEVTVAVAVDSQAGLFTGEERVSLFREATRDWSGCRVCSFSGLLVEEMQRQGTKVVVRGIRSWADYQHEWSMTHINQTLYPEGEFVFLLARPEFAAISSSLVRDVARHGGDVGRFVLPGVATALHHRYQNEGL
jgi:pantetheine-phosphate adenylyltransferase